MSFYGTITNAVNIKKENGRKGRVTLVDARNLYVKMGKSLGDKRNMISDNQIWEITELYLGDKPNHRVKIFKTTDFAYRKLQIECPLMKNGLHGLMKKRHSRILPFQRKKIQKSVRKKKMRVRRSRIG